ncbi:response regulator transcription factor [Aeromicrobium terrae]|uniref:Response regulator transcription factor n=1 Tax=Aeromicrobium terrae TaxID=2498846 RepID=A0A5C8NFC6_9ACTN|nr:response regulator transcription factor [Aeromicrobium terrae]TXL57671.1 response regulator transcription factor [Aeromicrobium terrae]
MTERRDQVLVVEDDPQVRDVVRRYLEREGLAVQVSGNGTEGLELARRGHPDLVVLDVMLPGLSGLEVCRILREVDGSDVPIVMLTALDDTDDRIAGLESGADDYVGKPFSAKELTLRIQSVLRRSRASAEPSDEETLTDGDLVVDPSSRSARRDGEPLPLTSRELDLLVFFLRHPGVVHSRADLLTQVWGWDFGDHSTVTVHVKRLRHKIEPTPSEPRRIVTVYGLGYRYDLAEESS